MIKRLGGREKMTKQPEWKYIGNLGDADPLEHGGYFIFEDETGVYEPEGEIYFPCTGFAYRFILERKEIWAGHLIPLGFSKKLLPHPIESYIEWFDSSLEDVANYVGMSAMELAHMFTSIDPLVRAHAYRELGSYRGFLNLDGYPLKLSRLEAKARYSEYLEVSSAV